MYSLRQVANSLIAYGKFGIIFGIGAGTITGILFSLFLACIPFVDRTPANRLSMEMVAEMVVCMICIICLGALLGIVGGLVTAFIHWLINGPIGCGLGGYIGGWAFSALLCATHLRELLLYPCSIIWAICGMTLGVLMQRDVRKFPILGRQREYLNSHSLRDWGLWKKLLLKSNMFLLCYAASAPLIFDLATPAWIDTQAKSGKTICPGPRPRWPFCWPSTEEDGEATTYWPTGQEMPGEGYAGDEWVFIVYAPVCWLWRTERGYVEPTEKAILARDYWSQR